jgi:1-acyl-sn-glycerol-3-phosphate acyltransferase
MITLALLLMGVVLLWVLWHWGVRRCELANVADWGNPWLNRLDGLNRIFCRRFHRLEHDTITLPTDGPALVVANHVSGLDPMLMLAASPRPLRFLIAREQYDRWYLRWLFRVIGCIPVERTRNPRAALEAARQALAAGEVVALFPHGRIHLDNQPPAPIKRGVVWLAQMSGAPIVPLRVDGVRAQGLTVPAVFVRSRARIRRYATIQLADKPADELLKELADMLTGRLPG